MAAKYSTGLRSAAQIMEKSLVGAGPRPWARCSIVSWTAIEFVMTVSDTIMVLNNGEVIAEGAPEEVRRDREVLEAYLGR